MAGIDKTYATSLEQYHELLDWIKKDGKFILSGDGSTLDLMKRVYTYTDEEICEYLKTYDEFPVLNTSNVDDYYIIKYCPVEFVRKRMYDVYNEEYIKSVLNGVSEFDTFHRNVGKKVRCIGESKFGKKDFLDTMNKCSKRRHSCWIEVRHPDFFIEWSDTKNGWIICGYELAQWDSNVCHKKIKSRRALIRHIRKWELPKGSVVEWQGIYIGDDLKFIVE